MKKILFILIVFYFFATPLFAATKTWTGAGADNLASTVLNWDTGTAPTTGDAVVYDGAFPVTGNKNSTWDITATIASINCTGYSGTFTLGAIMTSSGSITLVSGMTFTPSTYAVKVTGTSTITTGGKEFYGLTFYITTPSQTITLGDNVIVNNTLTLDDNSTNSRWTINSNTLTAKGDVTTAGNVYDILGTTNLKIGGSGNQNITLTTTQTGSATGINLPIEIASTGGTVSFTNAVHCIGGNLTYTSGTVDFTTNTSTIRFMESMTIAGSWPSNFHKVTFSIFGGSETVTISNNFTVGNTLTFDDLSNNRRMTINGSTITANGDITLTGNIYSVVGTTAVTIAGSGTSTITLFPITSAEGWRLPTTITNSGTVNFANGATYIQGDLTFNGTGTYNLANTINYKTGTITYTAGTVAAGTSTLAFVGTSTINTGAMLWNAITTATGGTVTLTGNLSTGSLVIGASTTLAPGSNTITLTGNFTKTGTFTAGTSTVTFNGTSTMAGATAFYNLTINSAKTLHLTSTQTFSTNASGAFTATSCTLDATTGASRAILTVNGTQSVSSVTSTDIDSSAGSTVHNVGGTNSNTLNWDTSASLIKTINGLAVASVKTVNGLATASMKTFNGLA